jgi:hypothetical protein
MTIGLGDLLISTLLSLFVGANLPRLRFSEKYKFLVAIIWLLLMGFVGYISIYGV